MTKTYKVSSSAAIDIIRSLLVPLDEFDDVGQMADALKSMLLNDSKRCFFCVVADEDQVNGFLLSYLDRGSVVKLLQVYLRDESYRKQMDMIFMRLLLWCEENNVDEIRLDTRRNPPEAWKTWGFDVLSTVMTLNVGSSVEKLLLEGQQKLGV